MNGISIEMSLLSTNQVLLRRGEMMQVISNLIANSMYAMSSGGTLSLSTEDTEDMAGGVILTVRDTGIGISAEDIPRVFDAFFTTRSAIGTGIGLFVARQFVEGHGGRIELKSSKKDSDRGTTVRIHLPLRNPSDAPSL